MSPEITESYQGPGEAEAPPAATYQGEIDPADMTVSPQDKPVLESETKVIGGPGDPRGGPSELSVETPAYGTETPYRKTPPTNISSIAEAGLTSTPPTTAGIAQASAAATAAPVNTVLPTISGTTTVGQTLTCAPGTWVPAAASYAYQWFADDVAINGATAATRVLAAGDAGKRMTCRVTGLSATVGGSSPVTTAQTAVVAAA